jgi:tetratricopeptide (TPR) repeat protein
MPALDAHRIFLSTVTAEFARYRTELAARFDRVSVKAVFQEEFEYHDTDLVEKLYQLILPCDVVIHFVGSAAGAVANPKAVEDFLRRSQERGEDFLGFWKREHGLDRSFFDQLTYTQWEAVLAWFLKKSFMSLQPQGPASDGHPPGKPPFTPTAEDTALQACHLAWLSKTIRRYPQTITAKDGSYLEDAFDKIVGFLLREHAQWQQTARQLQAIRSQSPPAEQRIAPTRLISRHTAADFLGRNKELALLDDAWTEKQGTANLLSIIAWGGVGKTALLAYWVRSRFTAHGWQDEGQFDQGAMNSTLESKIGNPKSKIPQAYFDWTFYDQGTRSDDATHAGAASVGTFFQSALKHFGDPDPESPHDKAARLARLIQAQRSLLVLDGLEPLQYPLNHPQAGQLTDPDLRELLGLLAQRNPGLVIISSRQALTDFTSGAATPTRQHDLEELPVEFSVALLRKMQIIGTDEELQQAATDYACHALSLIVLGRFLFVKGGDIRKRKEIKLETANENRNQRITRNAWHVLEAYEQWLASPAGNAADVQALRLTGLFDRPASPDCLAALRKGPAIPGLTDQLVPLSDDAWNAVLLRLDEAHLLQLRFPPVDPGSFAPRPEAREVTVDVHPLIREYFAKHLREQQAEGFQAAHSRLFDHLCARTEHRPVTLEGLQPLYQAVVHGCLAGRQQEACDKVYFDRIRRGAEAFSLKQLGAIGADLGAAQAFFEEPWSRLSANLSAAAQAWLLNEAAFSLRALGRLTEAVEPMRVSGERYARDENWKAAAITFSNLSELDVRLGRVEEAVANARRSIEFADRSGDAFQRMVNRTAAADALHQSGEREEARRLFEQAEALQRERQPQFDLLYSLAGFCYCDLILVPAERAAWQTVLGCRASVLECGSRLPLSAPGQDPAPEVSAADQSARGLAQSKTLSAAEAASLTSLAALADAERRATQSLPVAELNHWLLDIALDHLTLARVALYRALLEPIPPPSFDLRHATAALDGLRKAGEVFHLPRALLTAALHAHLRGDAAAASRALAEAQQIAERGPMPLFLADVHLHRARLAGSVKDEGRRKKDYPGIDPKAELAKARALIEKHGYGRRKEELADAEAAFQ